MQILILSDIHANVTALKAVLLSAQKYQIKKAVLLGDHIDYGMRPNDVIDLIKKLPYDVDINIYGNHEKAVIDGDLSRFSSERGMLFSKLTKTMLTKESIRYINKNMDKNGYVCFNYNQKKILAVHGSLDDFFWKSITPEYVSKSYAEFDYVLSGHSHLPCCFEKYFKSEEDNNRGYKKTVFINPGSVGQPRNHNPRACYAVLDINEGWVHLNNAEYDVEIEQALYPENVDEFYKKRIGKGL